MIYNEVDSFLIVSSARSGSTYLCELLDAQPGVKCYMELFHPQEVPLRLIQPTRQGLFLKPKARDAHPEAFVNKVFRASKWLQPDIHLIGGKLLLCDHQISHGVEALLSKVKKIIFLERRNKLAWFASMKKAEKTGVWIAKPNQVSTLGSGFRFDVSEFLWAQERERLLFNAVIQKLSLTRHQYIRLYYEDIQTSAGLEKLSTFLQIPSITVSPGSAWKQVVDFMSNFTNQGEVEKYAMNTGLTHWLC